MSVVYKLRYHPAAEQELLDIHDIIEAYSGSAIAGTKLFEIERVTKGLGHFPFLGSVRDGFPRNFRAVPAGDKAVICFTIDEDAQIVFIIAIGYAGSNWIETARSRL